MPGARHGSRSVASLPDDIHVMKKSKYSDLYGDYSTYFDEMDSADGKKDRCGGMHE